MHNSVFDLLIPHYCCSCGEIGGVLCEHCKYDIASDPFERCIVCLSPTRSRSHLCQSCNVPYSQAWCVGERSQALKEAINLYKYKSTRATAHTLVELLDATIPTLPQNIQIVPVPTIAPHIRVRGYDHTALLARHFAKRRGLRVARALERVDTSRQQGSSRSQRLVQAKHAFLPREVQPTTYLLIDDVYTTGATLHYAAKTLRDAGASEVYVAVLARQPLENT